MKPRSFTSLLDDLLSARGFERRRRTYWYYRTRTAVVVVNIQKSAFGAGVYVNYGVDFVRPRAKKFPTETDCVVFGRNPGLSLKEFMKFQSLLDGGVASLANEAVVRSIEQALGKQLDCLMKWRNVAQMKKRVLSQKPLDMIVDMRALGIEN
jgi:hypothetical protein